MKHMQGKSVYKVPNGKLLKVLLDFDGGKIIGVKLTGDFFAYPEDTIGKIEAALAGKAIERKEIAKAVEGVVSTSGAELFGVNAEAIANAILMAKEAGK